VKSTSEVKQRAAQRFHDHYRAWACGDGSWPHRVSLGRPTSQALSGTLRPVKDWIADWRGWDAPGTVEWTPRRTVLGPMSCPAAITFSGPEDIAALTDETNSMWAAARRFLGRLEAEWPGATERVRPILGRVVEMDRVDQDRLIAVCRWLHANPHSGRFLRQIPVEGIDTKWIGNRQGLVAAMLKLAVTESGPPRSSAAPDDDAADVDAADNFHERLGLRRTPRLIDVVLCDAALRTHYGGARTLGLTAADLAAIRAIPRTVLITENKETGYAVPDRDGLLVVHGLGLNLKPLADIAWLRNTDVDVLYWGDIDAAGFEWLNNLRGYGIPAESLLMTETVINDYRHLSTSGALPTSPHLPNLTVEEADIYSKLRDGHWGRQFLLEQERLPWPTCLLALDAALAGKTRPTPVS
jgi:hypothetical protein